MTELTNLPKVNDRFSSDHIDNDTLRSYSIGDATTIMDGIETLTSKKDVFEKILTNFNSFNETGRKCIHIWVSLQNVDFMVIYSRPLNNGFFEFITSSYRGNLQYDYSDSGRNNLADITQSKDTMICHIDDISHITIGNYNEKYEDFVFNSITSSSK